MILTMMVGQIVWHFYNERQLAQTAIASPDYQNCVAYFVDRLPKPYADYTTTHQIHCLKLTKWQQRQNQQPVPNQNITPPQPTYKTPRAQRVELLINAKSERVRYEMVNSQWMP